jgi:hypothetical protein
LGKRISDSSAQQDAPALVDRPIFARAAADNIGSLRVLQKRGFKISGKTKISPMAEAKTRKNTFFAWISISLHHRLRGGRHSAHGRDAPAPGLRTVGRRAHLSPASDHMRFLAAFWGNRASGILCFARYSTCSNLVRLARSFGAQQLIHEWLRAVHFSKCLDDRGGINSDGARLRVGVSTIGHQ